jgi:hypothetical protein
MGGSTEAITRDLVEIQTAALSKSHRATYRSSPRPGDSAPTSNPKRDSSRFWRL